jgi:hypothetical protein
MLRLVGGTTNLSGTVSAVAPNIQVCARKVLIGTQPTSTQIGGSARVLLWALPSLTVI